MFEKLKKKLDNATKYSKWATTASTLRGFIDTLPFTAPTSFVGGAMLAHFSPMLMGGLALTTTAATAGFLTIPLIGITVCSALNDTYEQHKKVTFKNDVRQVIQSSATQKSILNKAERGIRDMSRLLERTKNEAKRVPLRTELSELFAVAQNTAKNIVVLQAGPKGASASEYNYQTHKSPAPTSFFKVAT